MSIPTGGPSSNDRKIVGYTSFSSDISLFTHVSSGYHPLMETALPPPAENLNPEKAKAQILNKSNLVIESEKIPPQRKDLLAKLQKSSSELADFAKKHPFLTAGFVLGIIFLFCAFPTLASVLAHESGITLFHAQLAVGMGLVMMTIYYGVYLINLARRAALKDDLEARVELLTRREESLLSGEADQEFGAKVIQDAKKIGEVGQQKIDALRQQYQESERTILNAEKNRDRLIETQKKLQAHINSVFFPQLPQEMQDSARRLNESFSNEIRNGAKHLASFEPMILTPELVLEIPEAPTPKQIANQQIQQQMGEHMKGFFDTLGGYLGSFVSMVKENPISMLIGLVGTVFTLLAIPALTYWLSGYQSVYLIGSLGLLGAFQFVIYGLSLIYESYNSAMIEKLKKELKSLEETTNAHEEKILQAKEALEKIQKQAQISLETYQQGWSNAIHYLREDIEVQLKTLETPESSKRLFTEYHKYLEEFFTAISQIPPQNLPTAPQQQQVLNSALHGAEHVVKT